MGALLIPRLLIIHPISLAGFVSIFRAARRGRLFFPHGRGLGQSGISFWRWKDDEIHVAEAAAAKNFRSIWGPACIYKFAGRVSQLSNIATISIHNEELECIPDAAGKNNALSVGRPRGPAVDVSFT